MNLLEHCLIPDWPAPRNVGSLQTMRHGGVSAAPYASLNLGDHVGDVPLAVSRNRMLLQPLLPSEPVWLRQVHGTAVVDAAQTMLAKPLVMAEPAGCTRKERADGCSAASLPPSRSGSSRTIVAPASDGFAAPCRDGYPEADAIVSSRPGAVCVAMTADCLPMLLCDERGSIVGAVHAGWRGLCDGVIEATVHAMGVLPQTLLVWLGPAIGPRAFEVGDEVRAAFVARQPEASAAFVPGISDKWLADIYQLARLRLNLLGITRIYGGGLCTYTDSVRFFSYRRDGVTGRMGAFIWLR